MDAILAGDPNALDPWLGGGEAGRAGLVIYRNTVARARADALAALYPTVLRLVGEAWFREAASIFCLEQLPAQPVMDEYGAGFPDWLAVFPPAAELPFLAPVARIDRAWSEAHRAVDAPVLDAAEVSRLVPGALFGARAALHPSVRMFWFDWTVPSVWLANRPGASANTPVVWDASPEGLVVLRPAMRVEHHPLSRPQWMFLDACRSGQPLGRVAASLALADPRLDLTRLFAELLGFGVFTCLET